MTVPQMGADPSHQVDGRSDLLVFDATRSCRLFGSGNVDVLGADDARLDVCGISGSECRRAQQGRHRKADPDASEF